MSSNTQIPTVPPTMRAWVRRRRGPASSALELATDYPRPDIPMGSSPDVLIRVSNVSLQFSTEMMMKTLPKLPFTSPWVPEIELSGVVVAAGGGAPTEMRDPGTHVIAFQSIPSAIIMGHGVLAEYVRLPGSQVARIDDNIDMASASGIIGCGSTALKMIRTAGVREGHTVLVNGASGSVGSVLVQLCKLRDVKVVGVASGGNEAMVRGLGVDEFIDYREHKSLPAYLAHRYGDKPFDFVLDCVGTQSLFVNSPAYLKPEGAVVNIGMLEGPYVTVRNVLLNSLWPTWLGGVPRRYIMFSTPPSCDDAVYLARLIEDGQLRIPVDSVFEMKDAIRAYERIATKRARGKVVIKVHDD
ncbi:Polyketide synthase enoylreductase [Penicillium cf. griseofulvum]|uniref:Polyketide synthase enoylreductase n=1 Tax=Penicillium cf. griseofulvum TaxID=2972120 RepID=A0A9W9M9L1_9EURO|nr:Polyketide synthase enoylreductase [Penicillium cf. griseofulvum]KAJ5445620.1 Polyketide synthase enoylreductase [Penicillium cf. griseofulvum]KAJ5447341.1 Polyketide synthase enoylreductase [Penicillium cf. griseofulvum]